MRKALSKKLRFSVFERDNFTCQYCGRTPENDDVVLNVDHIVSVKNGGDNDFNNLLTSCFECNIGKGARTTIKANQTPEKIKEELERTKERIEQILAMTTARKKIVNLKKKIEKESISWLKEAMNGEYNELLYKSINQSIKNRFSNVPIDKIIDALSITENKHENSQFKSVNDFTRYFCGVVGTLILPEEAQYAVKFWRNVFIEHGATMIPKVRQFIIEKSFLLPENHENVLEDIQKCIQTERGKRFLSSPEVARKIGVNEYTISKSGFGFGIMVCDSLQMQCEKMEEKISEIIDEK